MKLFHPFKIKTMSTLEIVKKSINFNAQRIELTKKYMLDHYGIEQPDITIMPRVIVLHWTEIATLQESFECLDPPLLSNRPDIASEKTEVNVSAHFLVDRDGSIYQLMPDNWMARHVIGLNHVAIGIENVGGVGSIEDLTAEQITANAALINYLFEKYQSLEYLIGHYEYQDFRESELWLEKNDRYITEKKDPGDKFMQAVRAKIGLG